MNNKNITAIDRSSLPNSFLNLERQKSSLILEANLLTQQGLYPAAADKFAIAAEIEEQLNQELLTRGKPEKAFIHDLALLAAGSKLATYTVRDSLDNIFSRWKNYLRHSDLDLSLISILCKSA
ncbi:MAG: hypothetical protein AAF702_30535 [Chloroflexota bacterium]